MKLGVQLNAHLVIEISDTESIQEFYNLLMKISHKRFAIGFGIPKLTDGEKTVISGLMKEMEDYGFSNTELKGELAKTEKANDKS